MCTICNVNHLIERVPIGKNIKLLSIQRHTLKTLIINSGKMWTPKWKHKDHETYLRPPLLIRQKLKHLMVRERQPRCGNCAQYNSIGLSRFRILPSCYPDCIIRWLGECSPWLIVGWTKVGTKEFDHSLRQLHHVLPPLWGRDNWIPRPWMRITITK